MALITIQRTVVVCEDPRDVPVRPRRRVARLAVAGAVVALAAAGIGVSMAVADPSTSPVAITPLTTAVKVFGGVITANKTASVVVIGGSTTVPSNATTVELSVSAKGQTGGDVRIYPAGNESEATENLDYPAGNTVVDATFDVSIGESNEVTLLNTSTHAATVNLKVLGYSTQVTAEDISPAGGSDGQVLENLGDSVQWSSNFEPIPEDTVVVYNGAELRAALTSGENKVVQLEPNYRYDLGSDPLTVNAGMTIIGGGNQGAQIDTKADINLGTTGDPDTIQNVFIDFDNGGSIVAAGGFQYLNDVTLESNATTNQGLPILVAGSAHVWVDDSVIASNTESATSGGAEVADPSAFLSVKDSEIDVDLDDPGVDGYGILALGPVVVQGTFINIYNVGSTTAPALSSQGSGAITVHSSRVVSASVALDAGGGSIKAGASEISGAAVTSGSGTVTCGADYTAAFVAVPATC